MYVDETGDPGLVNSPVDYFGLSSITVHESKWRDLINVLFEFRKNIKTAYGLKLRTEIHASEYIRSPPEEGIQKHIRLAILRNHIDELAKLDFISVTSVMVDKSNKPANYDVFSNAWQALFQRFENTINYGNFPGGHRTDKGLVISDNTKGEVLNRMVRKMSVYNPVPSIYGGYRNLPLVKVIEDPYLKNSKDSMIIQACDVCAYFLLQKFSPCSYIRKKYATSYYDRLMPILNLKAAPNSQSGIVIL